jgi:two-component system response regulator YesN
MKIRLSKYLVRLILLSLFLSAFPVMTIGLFSYNKSSEKITEKVNEGNKQILQQTQMRIEEVLKTIDLSITQFANTPLVYTMLQKNLTPENFEWYNDLAAQIYRLQAFEINVRDVSYVNLVHNWILNNRGNYSLENYKEKNQIVDFAKMNSSSTWLSGLPEGSFSSSSEPNRSDFYNLYLVKKLPLNTLQPKGLIIVSVNGIELDRFLLKGKILTDLIIMDDKGIPIFYKGDNRLLESASILQVMKTVSHAADKEGVIAEEMKEFGGVAVNYRKSDYNGWTYLSLVKHSEIARESKSIGWLTFGICVLILLITLVFAFYATRSIYSPIRSLYLSITRQFGLDVSGKRNDELSVIGNSFQSLLQTKHTLTNELSNHQRQLKEFFMQKLLQGVLRSDEVREKWSGFSFPSDFQQMCIIAVQIDTLEHTRFEESDRDILLFAVNNIVNDTISADIRLHPIVFENSQVTVVGCRTSIAEMFKQEISGYTETVQKNVFDFMGLNVSIGISRIFDAWNQAPQAYWEALEALKYRIRLGQGAILMIDDLHPTPSNNHPAFPEKHERELLDTIKIGDVEKAEHLLHTVIDEIFASDTSPQEFQTHLVRLLVDIIRVAETNGDSFHMLYTNEPALFDQLFAMSTATEIKEWYSVKLIRPAIRLLQEHRKANYQHISDALLSMIHGEYNNELTLELCSSRLNMHPNYVGRVFYKETGTKFSEYLAEFRLKMAQQWLIETDMKIVEISEKLCYNNPQNFIRYFRKMVGTTPGKYRELHAVRSKTS